MRSYWPFALNTGITLKGMAAYSYQFANTPEDALKIESETVGISTHRTQFSSKAVHKELSVENQCANI